MTQGIVSHSPVPARPGTDPRRAERTDRIVGLIQRQGAAAVLAVVVLAGALAFPEFRSYANAATILVAAAAPMLIALGMTFVIITGGIDLSVGSLYVLGGVVAAYASQWGLPAAFAAPLLLCGVIGVLNGTLVAYARMAPFIVTLAALLGARGLMRAITDEGSTTYLVRDDAFRAFGNGSLLGLGYPVWLAAVLVLVGALVLTRTRFGNAVFAVGGSADAASLMGVAVRRTRVSVYVLSAVLAGLAGTINTAKLGSGVTVLGAGMELDAIAAVVIGGTLLTGGAGSVGGTVAGVLLLAVVQNLINQVGTLNSNWQQVVSGVFLAAVVVAQTYLNRLRRVS